MATVPKSWRVFYTQNCELQLSNGQALRNSRHEGFMIKLRPGERGALYYVSYHPALRWSNLLARTPDYERTNERMNVVGFEGVSELRRRVLLLLGQRAALIAVPRFLLVRELAWTKCKMTTHLWKLKPCQRSKYTFRWLGTCEMIEILLAFPQREHTHGPDLA